MELLYPNVCPFCEEKELSEQCASALPYIEEPGCMRCGKPLRYSEREYCLDCSKRECSYEQGKSVWVHKGIVRKSIYDFKYHNKRIYAKTYAEELLRLYRHTIEKWEPDIIIPVPLHPRRRRKRGYNQAEILADYIGEEAEIPVVAKAVYRKRHTNPQKMLDYRNRHNNLQHAFGCNISYLKGVRNVLIIDDIYTTGATIDEIAKTLKNAGVKKVYFLTISIGQGF